MAIEWRVIASSRDYGGDGRWLSRPASAGSKPTIQQIAGPEAEVDSTPRLCRVPTGSADQAPGPASSLDATGQWRHAPGILGRGRPSLDRCTGPSPPRLAAACTAAERNAYRTPSKPK